MLNWTGWSQLFEEWCSMNWNRAIVAWPSVTSILLLPWDSEAGGQICFQMQVGMARFVLYWKADRQIFPVFPDISSHPSLLPRMPLFYGAIISRSNGWPYLITHCTACHYPSVRCGCMVDVKSYRGYRELQACMWTWSTLYSHIGF